MRHLIAALPDQLRWAAALTPPEVAPADDALVAAMGGSAIAGDAAAVVADAAGRRLWVHRGYGLPGWVDSSAGLFVAISHSGDTEETIASFGAAREAGIPLAVVATGGALSATEAPTVMVPPGPQPRAAMGYLAGALLRLLEAAGVLPPQADGLAEAADVVEALLDGDGPGLAQEIAVGLQERAVLVYGSAGPAAVAARRWKTQINENAKAPAFWSELPEANHNELEGWAAPGGAARTIGVVFLRDAAGEVPRVAMRFAHTRRLMEDRVAIAGEVQASGAGPLARLFSLAVMGDLVSVSLAESAGVDPMPVETIEMLKSRLAEE